ncbi:chorismate mutase [Denitrobaculum tricleocarpae]|uniref:chorismate mutase n=1 Tax=Denitrobaculum tricleocarpae TaxID=2591009 RepID=A0A545TRI9_9PROT|nr:chorismate mutase [Denitrobaculum tricleocarpae]TQV79741.1 chorismate mutase [Denitrobaculum tricleocarpae]
MKLLQAHRRRIDELDDRIVRLFAERYGIIEEVAVIKAEHGIPSVLADRVTEVIERNAKYAEELGLDPDLVRRIYTLMVDEACAMEDRLMKKPA